MVTALGAFIPVLGVGVALGVGAALATGSFAISDLFVVTAVEGLFKPNDPPTLEVAAGASLLELDYVLGLFVCLAELGYLVVEAEVAADPSLLGAGLALTGVEVGFFSATTGFLASSFDPLILVVGLFKDAFKVPVILVLMDY